MMSSPVPSGTCWHSNYDQTRQFNLDYTQHGIRSYIYTDLLVCGSIPEVNREISIWKLESTVLRNYVSLIRGVLFLLSAQITELLTVFLHPYSKFLLVLATLMQTWLPTVKSQICICICMSKEHLTLALLFVGSITAFTHEKVNTSLFSSVCDDNANGDFAHRQRRKLF